MLESVVLFDDLLFLGLADEVLVELTQQMNLQTVVIVDFRTGAHFEVFEITLLQIFDRGHSVVFWIQKVIPPI